MFDIKNLKLQRSFAKMYRKKKQLTFQQSIQTNPKQKTGKNKNNQKKRRGKKYKKNCIIQYIF